MRLFVGIELSGAAKEAVLLARERLVTEVSRQGVRFVSPDKLHVTLAFLGQVDPDRLTQLMGSLVPVGAGLTSFDVATGGLGAFPDMRRPKVIWLGLGGQLGVMAAVASNVKEAARPFAPELDDKPFQAHVTLARVSPGSPVVGSILRRLDLHPSGGEMRVEGFSLFHSRPDGTYEVLDRFQLS
ncbi:MAG TPA: RNA 2',3'-cyclic phosphodiesterase [Fimbriimonadaceae bacterium]|nr:RNA 2',3'-cyclic phosphodiesterase [Fimbriimonadaceae bacterium]